MAGDGEEAPVDEAQAVGVAGCFLAPQLAVFLVLEVLLLVVRHGLNQDEEEEGDGDQDVQEAEADGAEGAVEGGEGEAEEEKVLVETDEEKVECGPAQSGVQYRPLSHVAPPLKDLFLKMFGREAVWSTIIG